MKKMMQLLAVVLVLLSTGSVRAVLWGDTIESKIDVIDANIDGGTTFLTSADIGSGPNIDISSGGSYTLADSLTTAITISAGCVTLDLNDLCLTGTIIITGDTDNVTIQNGTLLPPEGSGNGYGITVPSGSDRTRVSNLTIRCTDITPSDDFVGNGGIQIAGNDWIVENCTIISGAGDGTANAGGHGIDLAAAANNVVIRNCLISTGAGGDGGGGDDAGGGGGNGVNVNGSTDVEIADCTIFKTGVGGDATSAGGAANGGDGGDGIAIGSGTDISVHNCIIRNTGSGGASAGGGTAGTAGKAVDDQVAAGAAASIIFSNFAHNIANSIKYTIAAGGGEGGFSLSNPPTSTALSIYANVFI